LDEITGRRHAVVHQRLAAAQTGQPVETVLEAAMVDQQQVLDAEAQRALAAIDKDLRVEPELPEHLPDDRHRVRRSVPDRSAEADLVDPYLPRGHSPTVPYSDPLANRDSVEGRAA